ncbi:hypothetical protein ACOMHN_054266 [Nucella lapillus]
MSRSGAKTGAKDRDKAKPALPTHPPANIIPDIVPGRFSENDWLAMLERDSAVDFVLDFIDEILAHTMGTIHKSYLSKQVVPFTVFHTITEVLRVIEWKFLGRDDGEVSMAESGWVEDEEPSAAVLDSWAQGAVPKTEVMTSYLIQEEEDLSEAEEKKWRQRHAMTKELEVGFTGLQHHGDKVPDAESGQDKEATSSRKKTEPNRRPSMGKPKIGPTPTVSRSQELISKKSASTEKAASSSSRMSGHVLTKPSSLQGAKKKNHVSFCYEKEPDEQDTAQPMMKLDAETFPSHKVCIRYHIVEQDQEAEKPGQDIVRQGTLIIQHHKKSLLLKPPGNLPPTDKFLTKTKRFIPADSPPTLLETIKVAPGVTVLESGRTKKVTKRKPQVSKGLEQHLKALQPISMALKDRSNTISVLDLLDPTSPVIRPLENTKPLPPILEASTNTKEM